MTIEPLNHQPRNSALSQDVRVLIAMGLLAGFTWIDKFGENPVIDTATAPEDVWEAGGLYIYDADGTAPIVSLVSDDAGDTEPIYIVGLDIDGYQVEQVITLNGLTRVDLDIPLWRVYRLRNLGTTDLVGIVYCYASTDAVPLPADVRAIIDDGNSQTLMALYTIPRTKVGFLFKGEVGVSRSVTAGEVRAAYYSRRVGEVFTIKKRVNLSNAGTSIYQDVRSFPDPIPALTDIRLTVESVSANNMGVFGTFDIVLVDQELFSQSYLDEIGQPAA